MIQDVAAQHCGDKKKDATLHETFSAGLHVHDIIVLEFGGKDCSMFIPLYLLDHPTNQCITN